MPSRHRRLPIPFRPPEGDHAWLIKHAKDTGMPVNRILTDALCAYRQADDPTPDQSAYLHLAANLGLATTRELLQEVWARIEVDGKLDYRTVDSD